MYSYIYINEHNQAQTQTNDACQTINLYKYTNKKEATNLNIYTTQTQKHTLKTTFTNKPNTQHKHTKHTTYYIHRK